MDGRHRLTHRVGSFQRVEPFDPTRRSLVFKTLLNDAQVLGEELTAAFQGLAHLPRSILRQLVPRSGFLSLGNANLPRTGLRFGEHANAYALDSGRDGVPMTLAADGYLLSIGGASTDGSDPFGFGPSADRYCTVVLPPAPSVGGRDDLVFLEYWFAELDDAATYYPWGCVQYSGDLLTNDILNPAYSTSVDNKDVVLRWQIRVIGGVDFWGNPWGLADPSVHAEAGGASTFPYEHLGPLTGDGGLWRAGDGSDDARADLGTTDGYAYAVPLQRIRRRNASAFDLETNPNGAGAALGGASDRPDGRFHDSIVSADVQDLRLHAVVGERDWTALTRAGARKVFANDLRVVLAGSSQPGHEEVAGTELMQADGITSLGDPGVQAVGAPDGLRRVFSDEAIDQVCVGFLTTGADALDLGGALRLTEATRTITLSTALTVAGATIAGTLPVLRWVDDGQPVALADSWSDLGTTTATAVLDAADGAFQPAGELMVEFVVALPDGHGLTHVPLQVHEVLLNGTAAAVAGSVDAMTLAALPQPGDCGVVLNRRTRGIEEIARREPIVANGNGVARATGLVLEASAGTVEGGLVTGLAPGQAIDVIACFSPTPTDRLWVFYDHVPPQVPELPAVLGVELLHIDDALHVSTLGTGGGVPGVPYLNPLLQIPDASDSPGDHALKNDEPLGNVLVQVNTGLLRLPLILSTPPDLVGELSSPATDAEGRPHYTASDTPFLAVAPNISTALKTAQRHRSALFGVARVAAGSGLLTPGMLVLLCFTETTDSQDARAGMQAGSEMAVAVFPLFEV